MSFLTAYTFSKTIDEQSNASLGFVGGGGFRDPRNPSAEKALSDFNVANRFVFSMSYDLPFGKGKMFGNSVERLHQRFHRRLGIADRNVVPNRHSADGHRQYRRVELRRGRPPGRDATSVSVVPTNQDPNNWINSGGVPDGSPGTYGNAGRNIITTAGVTSVDLSAFKDFPITERAKAAVPSGGL